MNINNFDFNLLRIFDAIYAHRNLTRVAELLHLSQPAVSNALQRLRDSLSDPLFVRTRGGMMPTSKAEYIAPQVQQIVKQANQLFESSQIFDPATARGSLRIAMSDYCSSILLPSLTQAIRHEAPAVQLSIQPVTRAELPALLKSGQLDLAITDNLDGPGLFQQALYQESFQCIAAKDHPRLNKRLSLQQYTREQHILYSPHGSGISEVDQRLAEQEHKRQVVLRLPHISVIPEIIAHSDYLATLPRRFISRYVSVQSCCIYTPPLSLKDYSVKQFWHERVNRDPMHHWLRQLIHRRISSEPDSPKLQ